MPLVLISVCLLLATVCSARSEETAAKRDEWNLAIDCQMVVLPQKIALSLLPDLQNDDRVEHAVARVQELLTKGEAELAGHLTTRTREHARTVVETIEEVRYATEFDPPQLPPGVPQKPELLKDWPITGITPTSFDTRNIGMTLELEVTVRGKDQPMPVSCVAQHVRFLRWAKTDSGKLPNGEHLFVEQPIFHTCKTTSAFSLSNGKPALIGVHKVPDAVDRLELFILKVTATPVEK